MSKRQIILDTETTGLYAEGGDRLVEFAGLEMINRQMTDNNLHLYIHPERDMPEEAAKVHGLTIEVLEEKNAPPFAEVGRQIADFIRDAELIIHNAKFDVGFLNMEFRRMGLPSIEELGCTVTDTLAMAREMFPGQKASLDALCNRLSVDRSKRVLHGALIDCELLGEVYLAMTRQQFDLMGGEKEEDEEVKPVIIAEGYQSQRRGTRRTRTISGRFGRSLSVAQSRNSRSRSMTRRHIALIPAAGIGTRFGAGKPKQYVEINGKTVLQHTIDIFEKHPAIDLIAVIVSPEDQTFQTTPSSKTRVFRVGGASRAETVRNGVSALLAQGLAAEQDNILVHDAARCCLPPEALTRLIEEAGGQEQGGILAIPVADTLKRADGKNHIGETVSRAGLWQAQTPQLFQTTLLHGALSVEDLSDITDEASAVEKLGVQPLLVQGDTRNLKLTLPQDEYIVRLLLQVV